MRFIALTLILLVFCLSSFSYAREIFESGYSGSFARDGYTPDNTIDVFSGKDKLDGQSQQEVYSAYAFSDDNPNTNTALNYFADNIKSNPVYVAPITRIIQQAVSSGESNTTGNNKEAE